MLSNIGNETLTGTGTISNPDDFQQVTGLTTNTDCVLGQPLAPGSQCNLSLAFAPPTPTATAVHGTLELSDNSLNGDPSTHTMKLSGTGPGYLPAIELSDSFLNYGTITYPGNATKTLTIKNNRSGTLTVSPIINGPSFKIASSTCGSGIALGLSCALQVEFDPIAIGAPIDQLTLQTNASTSPVVTLSAVAAGIAPIPSDRQVQFGVIPLGTTKTLGVAVHNYGVAGAPAVELNINGPSYKPTFNSCGDAGLPQDRTCGMVIEFKPKTAGVHNETLTVTSSSGPSSSATLLGTASLIVPQKSELEFGTIPNKTTEKRTLIVQNYGAPGAPTLSASVNGPSYAVLPSGTCMTTGIPSGQTCTLTVLFEPQTVGTHNDTLTITPSSGGAVFSILILGVSSN